YQNTKTELTLKEFQVFDLLLRNEGKILSKETFIERIWGFEDVEDSIVEVYISFIRKKIKVLQLPYNIKTVRGAGYMLEGSEESV
ncbi:MAG TPA: winged helix-turn-helix domain-containing protein, partial [Erysipelothrix sp.]|nr:winged helix-turn-helix domain-containing protein [Erysipelothrix sp.]